MDKVTVSSFEVIVTFAFKYILTKRAVTDSDSLAHLNDDETIDNTDGDSGDSYDESDGGVGLGD
jgi:hypothetical protein